MTAMKRWIQAMCDRFNVAPITPTFVVTGALVFLATVTGVVGPIIFLLAMIFLGMMWWAFGADFLG